VNGYETLLAARKVLSEPAFECVRHGALNVVWTSAHAMALGRREDLCPFCFKRGCRYDSEAAVARANEGLPRVICGWCHTEMSAGTGPVSHGICKPCAVQFRNESGLPPLKEKA
jgi:hypothetical protein